MGTPNNLERQQGKPLIFLQKQICGKIELSKFVFQVSITILKCQVNFVFPHRNKGFLSFQNAKHIPRSHARDNGVHLSSSFDETYQSRYAKENRSAPLINHINVSLQP
jgi:hypothetical protein